MTRFPLTLAVILAVGWGCATGPRIDTSLNGHHQTGYGWNIGAGDLLDPATASCRLGVYLDELTAAGYNGQIRIIYTYEVGPFVRDIWLPVIRAKGYRILAILSQHPGDKDVPRLTAWIREGLPAIADVLDGVQLANEPDGFSGMSSSQYTDWHKQLVPLIRQVIPGVPILSPDFRGTGAWNEWTGKTRLDYGRDYDVVSLHVTHVDRERDLQTYRKDVIRYAGQAPRVWITEGDWGQAPWLTAHGLPTERTYIYVWNCNPTKADGVTCERETRRPGGLSAPECIP